MKKFCSPCSLLSGHFSRFWRRKLRKTAHKRGSSRDCEAEQIRVGWNCLVCVFHLNYADEWRRAAVLGERETRNQCHWVQNKETGWGIAGFFKAARHPRHTHIPFILIVLFPNTNITITCLLLRVKCFKSIKLKMKISHHPTPKR